MESQKQQQQQPSILSSSYVCENQTVSEREKRGDKAETKTENGLYIVAYIRLLESDLAGQCDVVDRV